MDFIAPERFIALDQQNRKNTNFENEAQMLLTALNAASSETDIQRYIKDSQKWFIPGSLMRNYDFGHHSAYLVVEPRLGSEYRADYMLLGSNSIGHHIVLVEFEDVNTSYKLKSENAETHSVRKGLTQIRDWQRWMDNHRDYFLESCGLTSIRANIPTWGINYCLVVSRRRFMDDIANQMRGQTQKDGFNLRIVTYDRLVDNVKLLVNGY